MSAFTETPPNKRTSRQAKAPEGEQREPETGGVVVDVAFDDAVATLTPSVAPAKEFDWASSHPAINRLDRLEDKTKNIRLTADDVLCPCNGPAPSQRAARLLQHWVNSPRKFWEQFLGQAKKGVGESNPTGQETVEDDGIADVQAMVRDVLNQLKEKSCEKSSSPALSAASSAAS
jgi:hypothetical protein